jgi:hypothetical protein
MTCPAGHGCVALHSQAVRAVLMGNNMGVLIAIASIIGAAALLIMRLGMIASASREIGTMAGDVLGAARRAKFRRGSNANPLRELHDPREAVVALMVAIARTEGDLTEAQARFIEHTAVNKLEFDDGPEILAHGRWLCQDVAEPGHVMQRVLPLLATKCDEEQKRDIIEMLTGAASVGSQPAPIQMQAIEKLAYDFGVRKTS